MINSIINGKELDESGRLVDVNDIHGDVINSVRVFDENLEHYIPDLLNNFENWRKSSLEVRKDAVLSIKENLENEELANQLSKSISSEIGKPMIEAETEISESIALLDFFIDNVNSELFLSKIDIDPYYETKNNYIKLTPLGIVGIIKPWNYPVTNSLWSIIPALLAGNVVIYKPSEYCCNTANILSDIIMNSRLPKGVFNILFGDWKTGQCITECNKISMISFTGGCDTAIEIQRHSIERGIIRKYSIESGGSDFAIVDKDANIDFATDGIVWGAFNNAGQVCTSIENVLIPEKIYTKFVEVLKEKLAVLKAGRDYGKIQNPKLQKRVLDYLKNVEASSSEQVIFGGILESGYLMPTLISCSETESANVELFSNAIRLFSYSDEKDIYNIVNSSIYGLGCTIWTNEPQSERIHRLINGINAGMIWVNDVNIAFPEMPWIGVKNSGVGFNLSLDAIKEFSFSKSISIDTNGIERKEWWYPYED